ncbi:MAG: LamG domain-containing protein, partial [Candidatus Latescibacteria bacterium]|nr:LamG domain-containing protein [Candidatus Latescibacterota bacterium]
MKRLPLSLVLRTLLLITLLFVQVVSVFAQGQGSVGRALRFDGVDDYVEVSHVQAYGNVQSEAFTIRAHFVINALTPEKSQVIIRKSHDQQDVDTWRLEITDQGEVVFFLKDIHSGYSEYSGVGFEVAGTDVTLWSDAGAVRAGEWVAISAVYDDNSAGEGVRLYVNGVLVREMVPMRPTGNIPQGRSAQSTGSIWMGEGLYGEIDQIAWYSRAFLPAEGELGDGDLDALTDALGIWCFEERDETVKDDVVQTSNHGTLF